MAGSITPIEPRPFISQTVTLADSTTVMELDPQPLSNTKEIILFNLSQADAVIAKVENLYGVPASAELNFDQSRNYDGQLPAGSLAYQDPAGLVNPVFVTQITRDGPPIEGDTITIDPSALVPDVTGAAPDGSNAAGSTIFNSAGGLFVGILVGWQLFINGSSTPYQIANVVSPNVIILSQPIPDASAGASWIASPGGPGPVPAITLTAASGTNAIKRTGTNGINAANSTTFEDLTANFLAAPAVNAGDSLYIDAVPYEIAAVVSGTELTLVTPIADGHTPLNYAAYQIATQFTFSAPTVALATIKVLVTPVPAGTDIVCTRPGRSDILLRSFAGAPPAFLPPINGNPGIAYFDGTGTVDLIAESIRRAINNIPAVTSVTLPNVLTSATTCMPLGRATDDGVDTVSIYGITQVGRVGTLDNSDQAWSDRQITGSLALFTITQFTTPVDANVWPDSPNLLYNNMYASGVKNVMWNVYKALVNPANGIAPYIISQTSTNFFNDNTADFPLTRTITLVATFNGTNGNNLAAEGTSPAPPSPPNNPKRVYVNSAGNPDPENFAGGVDALPTVSAVSVASSIYIPASSAITLSIGSEGNRQALNTSSFWATEPGSKFGIVLRCLTGEDVQCNVTYIQNRGYPDGV